MAILRRIHLILWLVFLVPVFNLFAQTQPSEVDTTFQTYIKEAWNAVSESDFSDSLQNHYAEEFFTYYKENKSSETADHALASAFTMWGNTGEDAFVDEALKSINYDSEVWQRIIVPLSNIYHRNEHLPFEEYIDLLHKLTNKLTEPESKSEVYARLARHYKDEGKSDKVVEFARKLVEINADEWYVEHGLGYLYEMESLLVGQMAPVFSDTTVQGNPISLVDQKGKIIILEFWAMWCGPCLPEIPHLKSIRSKYPESDLQIIGISIDEGSEKLKQFIRERDMNWPQVLQSNSWDDTIIKQYNVIGIPSTYIIGRNGKIVAKDLRGEELEEEIGKLMNE